MHHEIRFALRQAGQDTAAADEAHAAFTRLRDAGHSMLVVEHHLDVLSASDWIIELGPGGGPDGGAIVAEGTPEEIRNCPESPTGRAMARQ